MLTWGRQHKKALLHCSSSCSFCISASPCYIITPSMPCTFSACLQAHEDRSTGATGLSAQEGLAPLLKRLFILHSSKLMALAVFWAAMQQPGAIGWLLTCKPTFSCHTLQLTASSVFALHHRTAGSYHALHNCCMLQFKSILYCCTLQHTPISVVDFTVQLLVADMLVNLQLLYFQLTPSSFSSPPALMWLLLCNCWIL